MPGKQNRNPYSVLGISKSASKDEIKAAYRGLAKRLHPDLGGDPEEFAEATLCYEVLLDDDRRAKYDATGDIDENTVDNSLQKALNLLAEMFANASMGEPDPCEHDMVAQMLAAIQERSDTLIKGTQNMERARTRLQKMGTQFSLKKKAKGGNHVPPLLNGMFEQLDVAIKRNTEGLETLKRARTIIEDYTFKPDAPVRSRYDDYRSGTGDAYTYSLGSMFGRTKR